MDGHDRSTFNETILHSNFTPFRHGGHHPKRPTFSKWDNVVYEELSKFQYLHDQCIAIFDKMETGLLILGFLGNLLALITLLRGRHMRTPSFVYHKVLVLAYLVYCTNFIIVKCVNSQLTVPSHRRRLVYYNPLAAYYAVILNRAITSACGYLALYTSLAISVDRFLALVMFKRYAKFNRHSVAYIWVGASLAISICVHSWAPWVENEIHPIPMPLDGDDERTNLTIFAYRPNESPARDKLKPYLMAKDWYNLVIRFAYALLLTFLTSSVIYMFSRQQKKRLTLCHVSKRQLRRERSLFYLMVAVVIMAYIQVIPRESKRILELIYPPDYVAMKIDDTSLSIGTRRLYILFGLYAFTFTTPILNLCTTIERSLIFYFYFSLNHTFRREVLTLLHLRTLCDRISVKLGLHLREEREDRRRDGESEGPSRCERRYSQGPSRSTPSASPSKHLLCSETTVEHGNGHGHFLSPTGPNRHLISQRGSLQTVCSEYSSVV